MQTRLRWTIVTVACAAALSAATPAAAKNCGERRSFGGGQRLSFIGLTSDQRLVRFSECKPNREKAIGAISGLTGSDTALVGIDYRVQDGLLYGVGTGGVIYTLDTTTAAATLVSQLTVALDGANFGVDFNPAADRLRVVSDAGQNLRHDLNTDTTATDDALDYPPGAPANTVGPTATGLSGAAYTNNDLVAATATTLFVLDASLDQIAVQAPPNNGSLAATGKLTVDADAPLGFDVYSVLRDGATVQNRGFATFAVAGVPGFYRVDLLTGRAALIAAIDTAWSDIAIPLDQ
jgi:hypothetical protein